MVSIVRGVYGGEEDNNKKKRLETHIETLRPLPRLHQALNLAHLQQDAARNPVRLADVEVAQVLLERFGVVPGDGPDVLPRLAGAGFHLVVARVGVGLKVADIRDVDDVREGKAAPAQHPRKRVGEDIGAQVADVRVVVDGRPARIDAHVLRIERPERFELAGETVVERKLIYFSLSITY